MILADTSVWIDHLHKNLPELQRILDNDQIVMHPFVIGELALGPLPTRSRTIKYLDGLPRLQAAIQSDVRRMIETHSFHNRGIGLVDAHVLAAVLINPPAQLWTRDNALRRIAERLGVHVAFK
jgi:hypothetical protein